MQHKPSRRTGTAYDKALRQEVLSKSLPTQVHLKKVCNHRRGGVSDTLLMRRCHSIAVDGLV